MACVIVVRLEPFNAVKMIPIVEWYFRQPTTSVSRNVLPRATAIFSVAALLRLRLMGSTSRSVRRNVAAVRSHLFRSKKRVLLKEASSRVLSAFMKEVAIGYKGITSFPGIFFDWSGALFWRRLCTHCRGHNHSGNRNC